MEYNLYFYTKLEALETWEKFYQIVFQVMKRNNLDEPKLNKEYLDFGATYFTSFYMEEESNDQFYKYMEQEIYIKTNFQIYVQFGSKKIDKGMYLFFQVISELMKLFPNDLLFMEIEGTIIFERLNGKVLVNNHFDKYQKKLYRTEILNLLNVPYIYDDKVSVF